MKIFIRFFTTWLIFTLVIPFSLSWNIYGYLITGFMSMVTIGVLYGWYKAYNLDRFINRNNK